MNLSKLIKLYTCNLQMLLHIFRISIKLCKTDVDVSSPLSMQANPESTECSSVLPPESRPWRIVRRVCRTCSGSSLAIYACEKQKDAGLRGGSTWRPGSVSCPTGSSQQGLSESPHWIKVARLPRSSSSHGMWDIPRALWPQISSRSVAEESCKGPKVCGVCWQHPHHLGWSVFSWIESGRHI